MAKISAKDPKENPDGNEWVVILDEDGEVKRARMSGIAAAAAAPSIALAQSAANDALAAAASLGPFINPPAAGTAPARLGQPVFLEVDSLGNPVVLPDEIGLHELGSDISGAEQRLRCRFGSYAAGVLQSVFAIEKGNNTYLNVAPLVAPEPSEIPLANPATGAIIGYVPVRLNPNGTAIGGYFNTTFPYAVGGLKKGPLRRSTANKADVARQVEAALTAEADRQAGVFMSSVRTAYPRDLFDWIRVEERRPGHKYLISKIETVRFPGFDRISFVVRNATIGADIAEGGFYVVAPGTIDLNALPPAIHMTKGSLPGSHPEEVTAGVNWPKVAWGTAVNNYTLLSQTGIDERNCLSPEDMDVFLDRPDPADVLEAGAGKAHAGIVAATHTLYSEPLASILYNFAPSHLCNFSRQVVTRVTAKNHKEALGGLVMVDYQTIEGNGLDTVFHEPAGSNKRILENTFSGGVGRATLRQDNANQYGVHIDRAGGSPHATRNHYYDLRCIAGPLHTVPFFGIGISPRQHIRFRAMECIRENDTTTAAFILAHNSPNPDAAATLELDTVTCNQISGSAIALLGSFGGDVRNTCLVRDSKIHMISVGSTMVDGYAGMPRRAIQRVPWDIVGDVSGAVTFSDPGMYVLATTPGVSIDGALAEAVFGELDRHGFGWVLNLDGSNYSLGKNIGDCSTVNKSLQIGAQTYTATTDLRGVGAATIIAEINAACPANPVRLVRLSDHLYPTGIGHTMMTRNRSGLLIPAKRLLDERMVAGVRTLVLADGASDIAGMSIFDMPDNADDDIVRHRLIAASWFTQWLSGGVLQTGTLPAGEFGVTNGVLDVDAATKRAENLNGVVRLRG